MYTEFICPDGQKSKISDCLQKCRLKDKLDTERCLSRRTLTALATQREWTGIPSVTQLLSGTLENWLTIKREFAVNPQELIRAYIGTLTHANLEEYVPEGNTICEKRFFGDLLSGQLDFYDNGILYDDKTYGYWSTAKVLGLNGHKDRHDLMIQLNAYRMLLEKNGIPVRKMIAEILVPDANNFMAKKMGVDFSGTLTVVNKISDIWIRRYLEHKNKELQYYLETDTIPNRCRPRERWCSIKTTKTSKKETNLKCLKFCKVRHICQYGMQEMWANG